MNNTRRATTLIGPRRALDRRQFLIGTAAFGAIAVSGAPVFAQTFSAERSYKVGFVVPLTGPIAPEGEAMRRGLELGLAKLNAAGGIGGRPVELLVQDNQSQPALAAQLARKFIQQEQVDMIVGTVTFDEMTAVRSIAELSGTPFVTLEAGMYAAAGTPSLTCGSSMIILGETVAQLLSPTIPYMTERFGKKWAFVGSDYQFPRDYTSYGKQKLSEAGGTVVAEEYAPLGTADWSSIVSKLKAAEPEVILSSVVGGDAIAFIKAAESLSLLQQTKVTGISLQPEFYPAMGSAIDGQISIARYSPEIATAGNDEFKAAYVAAHGEGPIPSISSTAYDCWGYIKAAVERAGSFQPGEVVSAFDGVEASSILSATQLRIKPGARDIDYPMYVCEVMPGGTWKILQEAGVVGSNLTCE